MINIQYRFLSTVCQYRTDRTSISNANVLNYISTENMRSDKQGVSIASSLPDTQSLSVYLKNDILISNIRPYFKKIWFATKNGTCSNDVLVLKPLKNSYPKFLYYVLSDNNFFSYATVTSKGTKMPRGSKHAIMKYLVPNFSFSSQKHIADILSTYDDLIENNNRRITLLEQAAQELYKEWFVRFRFPGYENTKFENGLPTGWVIRRLESFGEIETGKTPSMSISENYGNDFLFIKTPDMHGNVFVIETEEMLSTRGNDSQPKKLIPANSIMVTCIGTGGIVAINAESAHTNQQINSIIPHNNTDVEWLFFTCKALKPTIELFGATGTTMTNLSKGKFSKLKVLDPGDNLRELYHTASFPMLKLIKTLMYQNRDLIHQRDLLLPRLINGQWEV